MKYIDSEILLADVENKLSSFFEQGSVDTSMLYPKLLASLSYLGLKFHEEKESILILTDRKVKLPKDFHKINCMYGCEVVSYSCEEPDLNTVWVEREVCEIPICKTECDYCKDDCGNLYEIVQQKSKWKVTAKEFFQLDIYEPHLCCNKRDFINPHSKQKIKISNGYIETNFEGSIYISYTSSLVDYENKEIKIPDFPRITEWIKDKLIVEALENLYLNGSGDVIQRLQYMQQRLSISEMQMESFVRTADYQDWVKLGTTLSTKGLTVRNLRKHY